jgi:hypothetical protein
MLNPHELGLFNYFNNLLPKVNEEFETGLRNRQATLDYAWMPAIVRYVDDPNFRNYWLDHGTMDAAQARQEFKSLPLSQVPDSANAHVEQKFWGDSFLISADYLYYADGRLLLATNLQRHIASFAEKVLKRERIMIRDLFANAFTTANGYQTWEAKALCDSGHHNIHDPAGATWTNYDTQALDIGALKTASAARSFIGPDGQGHLLNFDTLIIPPASLDTAMELLNSIQKPGGDYNDINVLRGKYNIVEVPDFLDGIITGSHLWWFLQDSMQHSLTMFYGKRPSIKLVQAPNGRDWAYDLEFDCVADWNPNSPYGMYGSIGTT